MLFTWQQIEWAGRVLLLIEFGLFVYWVVAIEIVGFADPSTFLSSISSAFHYGATFAVYAGISEIAKAHRRVATGRRTEVDVSMSNMWIAIAVVGLVTDVSGLLLIVESDETSSLKPVYRVLFIVLNSLFVAMTAVDILWLCALRAAIAVQNHERLGTSALNMVRHMEPPPMPREFSVELRL